MQLAAPLAPHAKTITLSDGMRIVLADSAEPHKPALVLIHGLQDEADSWQRVFEPLTRTHRVVALDLPGFGRSDKSRRAYTIGLFAKTVLAVMTQLGIDRAALAGNSLGGMIAEHIALTQTPRVTALALLSGTLSITRHPPSNAGGIRQRLFANRIELQYFETLRRDPQAAYRTLKPYYRDLAGLPQTQRDFLFQRVNERVWDEPQRRAAFSVRNNMLPFFALNALRIRREIAKLRVPTQVIWGADNVIFPTANGPARAALQPGAVFHALPECGHLPQQEQPERVVEILASAR